MPDTQEGLADKRGMILVISSPSGGGKTTLAHMLVDRFRNEAVFSVSATTRPPRDGEQDAKDYYFISNEEFDRLADEGDFLEHAEVFGNRYGTLRSQIDDAINQKLTVVLDVDWQGAKSVLNGYKDYAVGVFLFPPSLKELKARLTRRMANCSQDEIEARLRKAEEEMRKTQEEDCYNYIIRNDNLDDCFERLVNVFLAERCKRSRYLDLDREISRIVTS